MPHRNAKKSRCANCPPPPVKVPKPVGVTGDEGTKLWSQAIFTLNSTLEMLSGYATLSVPGTPVPQLKKIADRLNDLIKTIDK